MKNRIVMAPEGDGTGGGGGAAPAPLLGGASNTAPTDWRASLPEDIRGEAAFSNVKAKDANEALGIIGKSFINAQKLIGVDKIPRPNEKWTPEQWKDFNKSLGVPETFDKYNFADVKLAEGLALVPEKVDAFKKVFHEAGLTPRQVAIVSKAYLEDVNQDHGSREAAKLQSFESGVQDLKTEYGDKFAARVDLANAVLKKFGSEPLVKMLGETGLANNPEIVRMFVKIGQGMQEDRAGGNGLDQLTAAPTQALQEINNLKGDAEFMAALQTRNHPGHKAAVDKWTQLHSTAASSRG